MGPSPDPADKMGVPYGVAAVRRDARLGVLTVAVVFLLGFLARGCMA